jgi:membrane fusion protein (multidrug efflux system)
MNYFPSRSPSACLLGGAVLVLALAGCNREGGAPGGAGGPPGGMPPPEVAVIPVEPRNLPVTFEYNGRTLGHREIEVRGQVTGILVKRNYKEGAQIRKGESMFTIDPRPYQVALARLEADLGTAQARLAQAKREADRLKPVAAIQAASHKELDDALSAEQIAAAEVKAAQARVNEARLNLEYTRVQAPISGVAGRALRSEGSLVSGPDVLLTTVTQVDPMYVLFGLPEPEQLRLRREIESGRLRMPADGKLDVAIRLADGQKYAHTGKLDFTDARVDAATATVEARAELANPQDVLKPGQFVRVVLSGATRPDAIIVPQRAVLDGPQGKFVYVVNGESKVESRPVQVGEWTGDAWVITEGVSPGERVVVDGVMKIGPGAPVTVAAAKAPPDAKPASVTAPSSAVATSEPPVPPQPAQKK